MECVFVYLCFRLHEAILVLHLRQVHGRGHKGYSVHHCQAKS